METSSKYDNQQRFYKIVWEALILSRINYQLINIIIRFTEYWGHKIKKGRPPSKLIAGGCLGVVVPPHLVLSGVLLLPLPGVGHDL